MESATANDKQGLAHRAAQRVRAPLERLAASIEARLAAAAAAARHGDSEAAGFLPDFCSGWVLFNVVVVAELLAIVIAMVMPSGLLALDPALEFLLVSLYIQWIALAGTAVLCLVRQRLNRLPPVRALAYAYLLLLAVTSLVSEAALWLLYFSGRLASAHPSWYGDFHILALSISAIANGLLMRYFLAKHELKQRTLSEAHQRLLALKARIRPYFVFNSLNIIASLVRTAPAKAEAAIEDMAQLFRLMLAEDENLVPIRHEIEIAEKYLALETLRLDNRLHVVWDIGKFPRKAVMPVLTLQPLLEHAIRHGIEELPAGGTIDIRLWEEDGRIHIRVSHPLPHVRGGRARSRTPSPGQSLEDIRARFRSHYGEVAQLETREDDGRFIVSVTLPTRGGVS
jgi:two-component system sensor histidine kinase AlgZ